MTKKDALDQDYETIFKTKLAAYKQLIDNDIAAYSKTARKTTLQNYSAYSAVASDAFLEILGRGGKRIRGVLTMIGYEMLGGTNQKMILEAARIIEMVHAYILIIDDIQDRSLTRRGGPTAHILLADYHKKHGYADESDHFGVAVALNSALFGNHAAQMMLSLLPVEDEYRVKALGILNRTMLVTAHGQTNDIFNEVVGEVSEYEVDKVLEWKTANYTFLNPLHMGMVLAGAGCHHTDAITDYAMHAGRAFQITDDILGTFGNEQESGKSPMDDIREGKRTLLTVKAMEAAQKADRNFLIQMLGNHSITPAEFATCKEILQECGALEYAREQARFHITEAVKALERERHRWQDDGPAFLRGLVEYLLVRTA